MPSTEDHSSLMVLAATAVSGGEQADEEKTVRARDEEAQGESRGRVKKQKNILVKGEPTDSDTEEVKYVLRLCAIRAAKFGSTLRISNNFSVFSSAEIQKSEMSMLSLETIVKDALTDIQDHQRFCQVHGIKMKKGEMFDVEQPNDMKIGGAQGSLCCVVEKGIRPEELFSHFQSWDVATSSFSEDTGLMFRCANLLVALDFAPIPDQLDITIHVQDHFTRAKAGQDTTLARRHAGTLEKVELSVSKDLFFSTRYSVYALFIQELHRSHRKRLGDDDDAEYYLQGDGSNIVVLGESASACKVVHHSAEVKKLGGFQTALRTKVPSKIKIFAGLLARKENDEDEQKSKSASDEENGEGIGERMPKKKKKDMKKGKTEDEDGEESSDSSDEGKPAFTVEGPFGHLTPSDFKKLVKKFLADPKGTDLQEQRKQRQCQERKIATLNTLFQLLDSKKCFPAYFNDSAKQTIRRHWMRHAEHTTPERYQDIEDLVQELQTVTGDTAAAFFEMNCLPCPPFSPGSPESDQF